MPRVPLDALAGTVMQGIGMMIAQKRQGELYAQQSEVLKAEKKKLETYNAAAEQLKTDDPKLYQRLILGLGEPKPEQQALQALLPLLKGGQQPAMVPPPSGFDPWETQVLRTPSTAQPQGGGLGGLLRQPEGRAALSLAGLNPAAMEPKTDWRTVKGPDGKPLEMLFYQDGTPVPGVARPAYQEEPGRTQILDHESAARAQVPLGTTVAELRAGPGVVLPTPEARKEQERLAAPVPLSELKEVVDPRTGKSPVGLFTRAQFEDRIRAGTLQLKEQATAGETEKKLAAVVPSSRQALERATAKLYAGGKLNEGLLASLDWVPSNPDSWIAKGQRALGVAKDARQLAQDIRGAMEPIGRLLSGGVIGDEEAINFRSMFTPYQGDSDAVVRQKISALTNLYAEIERAADPNAAAWTPAEKSALRRVVEKYTGGGAAKPGDIEDGWEYLGGDKADPKSWRKVGG